MAESSANVFRWRVLSDQAIGRAQDDSFGTHAVFAQLLYELAQNCVTPFAVGLYSSWGTGKTSVARLLEQRISSETPRKVGYVYLDVWKYVSDPLKRWILLETERQLQEQSLLPSEYTFGGRTLESYLEFEEQWKEEAHSDIRAMISPGAARWFWIATLLGGPVAAVLWTIGDQVPKFIRFFAPLAGLIGGAGILGLFLLKMTEWLLEYLKKVGFQRITWHVQAKPAFSSEKFSAIFHDMVETASQKLPTRRIIFVFDNLDRCPAPVAIEAIAVVKTYLDERGCVYVIPCDEEAIVKHVAHSYVGSGNGQDAHQYAKEFLNKFFQMTLRLPAPVEFDLEAFVDKQLRDAGMHDLPSGARDVLVLGYRGETPRQVKRILNDLIGYLALATEAEKNKLIDKGDLTSDLPFLTKMSVISANWPEFLDRIAKDPEIWGGIMTQLQASQGVSEAVKEPNLEEFLARTRFVSPEADIRPYLFLKRMPYERDALLRTQVERSLRNGDLKQFQKDLDNPEYAESRQNILDISLSVIRKWQNAGRDVLVKNAAPLVVRAAATHVDNRDLVQEALNVTEKICLNVPTPQLESFFDTSDIFVLVAMAAVSQRRNILWAYTLLFSLDEPITDGRRRLFKEFLANGEILNAEVKTNLSNVLMNHYKLGKAESDCLDFLVLAGEAPAKNAWMATQIWLAEIAKHVRYSSDELDAKRLQVLVYFQDFLPRDAKDRLMIRVAEVVPLSPVSPPRAELPILTEALGRFKPSSLGDVSVAAANLLGQLEGHPVQEKAPFTKALLSMHNAMPEDLQARFTQALKASYLEANNPTGVQTFLTQLGSNELHKLLGVSGFGDAVRGEAQLLEAKFGLPVASSHRELHLGCFSALDLVTNLVLYDDSKPWDLVLYIKNVERVLAEGLADTSVIIIQLVKIADGMLLIDSKTNRSVYDALYNLTDKHPDLMNSDLARALAERTVDYLAANLDEDYRVFRKCLARLSPEDRTARIRQLENRCFRDISSDRTKLLGNVTEDVCSDPDVRANATLVGELFDFAYQAATDYPAVSTDSLLRLSEYLSAADRAGYLDRALDRLIFLNAGDQGVDQMEPFLRFVEKFKQEVTGEAEEKLGRFLKRMLSPASEKQRKLRAIETLTKLQSPLLIELVRPELQDMAQLDDIDLASKAAQFGPS